MAALCTRKEGQRCKLSRPTAKSPVLFCNEIQTFYVRSVFSFYWSKKILKLTTFCPFFLRATAFLKRAWDRALDFQRLSDEDN